MRARIAQVQGFYYAATALWALFDIDSFEWLTGFKTDDWLVKTVAVLILAVALSLIVAARRVPWPEITVLGMSTAIGLFGIDCFYVWRDTISPIYLLDAMVEAGLAIAWTIPRRRRVRIGIIRRAAPHWRSYESR